jgi:hypothetical protein
MARKIQPLFDYDTGTPETGTPPPPRELGAHGKKLWDRVQAEYRIVDIGGIEVLAQICAAVDTLETLAGIVRAEGVVIQTSSTRKTHPAIREQTQLRAFVVRSLHRSNPPLAVRERELAGDRRRRTDRCPPSVSPSPARRRPGSRSKRSGCSRQCDGVPIVSSGGVCILAWSTSSEPRHGNGR